MEFDPDERARLRAFETLLDGSKDALEPWVELTALRKLCARGIPDHPRHLRPLAYSLLLGVLPPEKKVWRKRSKEQRKQYHTLVEQIMDELDSAPLPSDPLSSTDSLLSQLSKDLDRAHSQLPFLHVRSNPSRSSPLAPPLEDPQASASDSSDFEWGQSSTQNNFEGTKSFRPSGQSSSSQPNPNPSFSTSSGTKREMAKTQRILSRRAASKRLELIAETEHRRHFANLDKGKARSFGERQSDSHPRNQVYVQNSGKNTISGDSEIGVTTMSPRITLSPDESEESTLPSISSALSSSGRTPPPPPLSLSIPSTQQPGSTTASNSQPHSPITLVSPKVITGHIVPPPASPALVSGSLLQPDSHGEIILRLLFIFCKSRPDIVYTPALIDTLIPLYLIYVEADISSVISHSSSSTTKGSRTSNPPPSLGAGRYAEEETYMALIAILNEFGSIVFSSSSSLIPSNASFESRNFTWALEKLGRRVRWADEGYWSTLRQRNLDPSSPLYAYQWITLLLAGVTGPSLTSVWDFLFSEPPSTPLIHFKADLLIDLCAAMLFLIKDKLLTPPRPSTSSRQRPKRQSISPRGEGASLWGDLTDNEEEETSLPPAEDPDAAFVRGLQLLRNYPLQEVGGIEALLQYAFELRQARMVAALDGSDPDSPGWMKAQDSKFVTRASWTSEKLKAATQSSLASTSKLFSSYAESFQQSDTAASLSRASTNLTASAMAKWGEVGKTSVSALSGPTRGVATPAERLATWTTSASTPKTPSTDWKNISATAGKWWSSMRSPPQPRDDESVSGDEDENPSPQTTKRDSQASLSFNLSKIVASPINSTLVNRRERSDSTTSGFSITSIQDRLSHLTTTITSSAAAVVTPSHSIYNNEPAMFTSSQSAGPNSQPRSVSGPRPLLLSDKARRASNASSYTHQGTSPTRSPSGHWEDMTPPPHRRQHSNESILTSASMSDAPYGRRSRRDSPSVTASGSGDGGLYRIGSRSTNGGTPRTPGVGSRPRPQISGDTISLAARRLHDATSTCEQGGNNGGLGASVLSSPAASGIYHRGGGQSPYRRQRTDTMSSLESEFEPPMNNSRSPPNGSPRTNPNISLSRINGVVQDINTNGRVSALVRKYSSDSLTSASASGGGGLSGGSPSLARGKVVSKKFQKRPTSLRLGSMDSSAQESDYNSASGGGERYATYTAPPHASEYTTILTAPLTAPPTINSSTTISSSTILTPTEPISIPTPQIAHLTEDDYENIYEPAEDSFILLDALESDALVLRGLNPSLCVEIGSGSGIASTFLDSAVGSGKTFILSTDINAHATAATLRTGTANNIQLNPILCNLLDPLMARLEGQIDVLIFNPPYVETEETEMTITQRSRGIGGAWAGGEAGMGVTNLVLEQIPTLLSPGGRFYLVAIQQNKPDEILSRMTSKGLECKVILKRRAGRELLSVIRMIRPFPPPRHAVLGPRSEGKSYSKTLSKFNGNNGCGLSIPSPLFEESDRSPTTPRASAWHKSGNWNATGNGETSVVTTDDVVEAGPNGNAKAARSRSPRKSKQASHAEVTGAESEDMADDEDENTQ